MRTTGNTEVNWRAIAVWPCLVALVVSAAFSAARANSEELPPNTFRELQLGYLALEDGRFEAAVGHYSRALDRANGDQQRFNALFGLGSAALELGRLDEANEAFQEAHLLDPAEVGATFMLGVTSRRRGELDAAVKYLAEAAVRDPDLVQALVELGIAYAALERHTEAEEVCRKVLTKAPDHIEARIGLAVALYHQDQYEAAVTEFRAALELDPDNLRAHYGLGLALVYSGDTRSAFEEVVYLKSRSPELAADLREWVFADD